jgi:hypothetical protein
MQDTPRNRWLLAGLAGVTLALGVAVSAGAVPRPGDDGNVRTVAASSSIEPVAGAPARQPGDTGAAGSAPTTAPPTTVAPATTVAKAPAATTPTTKPRTVTTPAPAAKAAAPAATAAPVTTPAPAAPAKAARRVPSASEVQSAISQLPQYVHSILTPSPAQVAQLGDQVCTAFDNGQTFAQVKATGLSMVTQVPLTTVLPGGADWVVKTVVNLYCPGYASKLV